jgi:hypothetical protein
MYIMIPSQRCQGGSVEQRDRGELEYDLRPFAVVQRVPDASHVVEPGGQGEKARPVHVDVDGMVQRAVVGDVLDDPGRFIEPRKAPFLVNQAGCAVEHQGQRDCVRG